MEDRDARWYYYSAQANAGKGNQATAMEHARRAVELAPDNMQYRMFYQRMNSGGEWKTADISESRQQHGKLVHETDSP